MKASLISSFLSFFAVFLSPFLVVLIASDEALLDSLADFMPISYDSISKVGADVTALEAFGYYDFALIHAKSFMVQLHLSVISSLAVSLYLVFKIRLTKTIIFIEAHDIKKVLLSITFTLVLSLWVIYFADTPFNLPGSTAKIKLTPGLISNIFMSGSFVLQNISICSFFALIVYAARAKRK